MADQYGNNSENSAISTESNSIRTKTTAGRLWIVPEIELDQKIEIQFVPREIAISRVSAIQTIAIVGRNNPFYQYTGGETTMPIQLDFYAEDEDRKDVLRKVRFLESLSINNGYKNPPQRIHLIFGDIFKNEMWVIKSVKTKLSNFDKPYGMLPKQAYVDLELALDTNVNLTRKDLRNV